MARRKQTLDDLLRPLLAAERFSVWCKDVARVSPWTILRIRQGRSTNIHRGTVLAIVSGLAAEGIEASEDVVRAACEASRDQAAK